MPSVSVVWLWAGTCIATRAGTPPGEQQRGGHSNPVRFIGKRKDRRVDGELRWRIEPICQVLTEHNVVIAPATYDAAKTRPASARAIRDTDLTPVRRTAAAARCEAWRPTVAEKPTTNVRAARVSQLNG